MMSFILISLKHCYLWFILATPGQAPPAVFLPYFQFTILHCPPVDTTHISPPVHIVWHTSLCLLLCVNWIICTTNLQACLVGLTFCFWAGNLHNYSIHSIGSCCNLREHPLNHFFLTVSHPPLLPLSSCHQTITLVLHPFSSLLPPPSKTLVLPHMKPKVSSRDDSEL